MRQRSFELKTWGGKRDGAGRKPSLDTARRAHVRREAIRAHQPVHFTLRLADHVWNLRSQRSFRIIDAALRGIRWRPDFRVVHFSIQGNHVHLIVEAGGSGALANGIRALGIRLARRLNAMMGRSGRVFADRYRPWAYDLRLGGTKTRSVRVERERVEKNGKDVFPPRPNDDDKQDPKDRHRGAPASITAGRRATRPAASRRGAQGEANPRRER